MKLVVSGMSGSGKGEAIKRLVEQCEKQGLTYKVYKEDTNSNLYKLAQDNKNLMYLNQLGRAVNFMTRDIVADSEKKHYDLQIFDRSSQELMFYNAQFLTSAQRRLLNKQLDHLYSNSRYELGYDAMLLLTVSSKTMIERIKNRGRDDLPFDIVKKYININEKYYNSDGYSKLGDNFMDMWIIDDCTFDKLDYNIPNIVKEIKESL